jgi:hypothetical protein
MSSPFTLTLTPDQRADFERDGVLVLPGYFPTADMNAMADALWADLFRRFAIDRRRPETWTIERPGKFQPLIRAGAFRAFGSERLMAIGDAFLGAGRWQKPRWLGYPLVTFPTAQAWDVPHRLWHLDISASLCLKRLPYIRVFTFLAASRPMGGGTPYVVGSHRLALSIAARTPERHLHSRDIRLALAAEQSWFAALFAAGGADREQRFMRDGAVIDGVAVAVREMLGEPGDAILMHPALLHGIAVNALRQPRMMLMQFLGLEGPLPADG